MLRTTRLLIPLSAALVLLCVGAVVAGIGPAPTLIAQSPLPNVFDADPDGPVIAVYDLEMDPGTVGYRSFAVHAMQTGWISESLGVLSGTVSLTPTAPFHPGELVQVSATTATLSLSGVGPISPTVWQFQAAVAGGTAMFFDSGQRLGNDDNRGAAIGDLDGDGDLDVVTGVFSGPSQVWLNDGGGVFTHQPPDFGAFGTIGISLGDLDGDGDLDLVESSLSGVLPSRVWFNDGTGLFTNSGQELSMYASYASLGDLDGDGDLDLFFARANDSVAGLPNQTYLNDGSGVFTLHQTLGGGDSGMVGLGDLDGDGDLDAFVSNGGWSQEPNEVWFNDGTGLFTDSGQALGNGQSFWLGLGDLNGDGYLDVYVPNGVFAVEPDEVWINDGTGNFKLQQSIGNAQGAAVGLGDLDMDGDLDAVVSVDGDVLLNDGTGTFTPSGQQMPGVIVALGDLDGNGSLDAFFANGADWVGPNEVWLNVTAGVDLTATVAAGAALPDSTVSYTLTVENTGNYTDEVSLSASAVWTVTLSAETVVLGSGESAQVTLEVLVPAGMPAGGFDITTVTATSGLSETVYAAVELETTAVWAQIYLPHLALE